MFNIYTLTLSVFTYCIYTNTLTAFTHAFLQSINIYTLSIFTHSMSCTDTQIVSIYMHKIRVYTHTLPVLNILTVRMYTPC